VKRVDSHEQLEIDASRRPAASTHACSDSPNIAAALGVSSLRANKECTAPDAPRQTGDWAVYNCYLRSIDVRELALFIASSATAVVFAQFISKYRCSKQPQPLNFMRLISYPFRRLAQVVDGSRWWKGWILPFRLPLILYSRYLGSARRAVVGRPRTHDRHRVSVERKRRLTAVCPNIGLFSVP
jgi:hypothetical protein